MNKKIFAVLSVGFLSVFTLMFLIFADGSTAKSLNIEEKFSHGGFEKVSEDEQMGEYSFDKAHSSINFRIKHMGLIEVPGNFREFEGKVNLNGKKLQDSSVEFTAVMKSVDTGVNARDNHLRSKDFFDVIEYPEMTFKSKKVKKKGENYLVTGDFTMKGVTKEITIPMQMFGPIKDGRDAVRMGVTGRTVINRRDFKIDYGTNLPNGTPMLSDTVIVDLQIESLKEKAKE